MKCRFMGHEAAPNPVRNQGLEFSRCRHCRRDLVRSSRQWRSVPRGFRVVWRSGELAPSISADQYELDLASPGRQLVPWRAGTAWAGRARQMSKLLVGTVVRRLNLAGEGAAYTREGQDRVLAGRTMVTLLRLRARIHFVLWPVAKEEACIRLPYRPIALQG